jgi:hypothetical protein
MNLAAESDFWDRPYFGGSEATTWLVCKLFSSAVAAVKLGQNLIAAKLMHYVTARSI